MTIKRLWIAACATLVCLTFAWATGAGRPHPANAGGVIDPTCTSSLPCIEYDNNGTGPGIRGVSLTGNGSNGITRVNSTSAVNGREGVFGNDMSTSGSFNSGVRGLSVRGTGVLGNSTSGAGVQGSSAQYYGVFGQSNASGVASVYGAHGNGGYGVYGRLTAPGTAGVFADAGDTGSIAMYAVSNFGIGANVIGGNSFTSPPVPTLSIVENINQGPLIDACMTTNPCDNSSAVFAVEFDGTVTVGNPHVVTIGAASGNININGQYKKNGTCVAGCVAPTATSAGRAAVSYVATQSLPTIDDFGEAAIQNGSAYVRLDPAFANVIDQSAKYLVFITPEGDSRGLYVTEKSVRGFAVHENMGGHSSLGFSYRIVAKPFVSREARLPMVELPKLRTGLPKQRAWHPGAVVPH